MNVEQLEKIKYLQSIQEEYQRTMSEYRIKWLLSDNTEEKIILKKQENIAFEKMADTNSKIRKALEDNNTN